MVTQLFTLMMVYVLIISWILFFTYSYRKRITCMVGMMIAMVLGMTIGLSIGTVIGMSFPNYFFQATLISMFIGGMVGVFAGLPISMMAILDGLLSGLMGGMMGAMMGVMIPSDMFNTVTKIMAILSVGILYILFLMIQGEIKFKDTESKWTKLLFGKPHPYFLVICLFLFMVHQFQFISVQAKMNHSETKQAGVKETTQVENNQNIHAGHVAVDQPMGNKSASLKVKEIIIEAEDFGFTVDSIQLKQGEMVNLVLKNKGKIEHDFEIVGTDIHVHAQPGAKGNILFSLDKPGTYTAICTLPGHEEAGMIAKIEVNS